MPFAYGTFQYCQLSLGLLVNFEGGLMSWICRLVDSMRLFLFSTRSKWLCGIAVVAIGAGVVAKSVILYPHECGPSKAVIKSQLIL